MHTLGWVSFGFSPDGNMPGSNVMVFYMDQNNMPNFSERYLYGDRASPYSVPRGANRTANQSWKLIYQRYYNGYTIVGFQRPIVLCGANQLTIPVRKISYYVIFSSYFFIQTGTPYGIFAFGSTPAPGADIGYHGSINRGSKRGPFVSVGNTEYNDSYFSLPEVFTISNVFNRYSICSTYYHIIYLYIIRSFFRTPKPRTTVSYSKCRNTSITIMFIMYLSIFSLYLKSFYSTFIFKVHYKSSHCKRKQHQTNYIVRMPWI